MKKIILAFTVIFLLQSPVFAADKIEIVSTVGQLTNVIEIIGDERVNVQGLMGPGVDPHLYKASESDVRKLSRADIIFYNGLFLEAKMGEILKKMSRSRKIVAVGESIDPVILLDSETYEGHYDPHIWFDVTLWMTVVEKVRDELIAYAPQYKDEFTQRTTDYMEKLTDLHDYVHARSFELDGAQRVLVTAHDAFRYFGRAYDFKVVGLQGISTQSEAGAGDVKELAKFIAERKLKAIFVESSVPERNIQAVQQAVRARGWNVEIGGELFSDAMGDEGTFEGTYLGMVTHNIDTIVNALKSDDKKDDDHESK